MTTYLVEEFNENITFEDNSNIIALNPKVCYQLDKVGIKYQIIEDYYPDDELFNKARVHFLFKSQLKWVDEFDDLLQEHIPQLKKSNFRIGYWYITYLKYIIDTTIIESIVLDGFFKKTKHSNIIHVTPRYKNYKLDHILYLNLNNILLQLIPLFCEKYSVIYRHIEVNEPIDELTNELTIASKISAIDYIKKIVRSNDILFNLYTAYESKCWRQIVPSSHPSKKLSILMLKLNWGGDLFVRDALRRGHDIYLKSNNTIYRYTAFGLKKYHTIPAFPYVEFDYTQWQNASKQLTDNLALFEWINVHCGVDISDTFTKQFNHLISVIAPELLYQFNAYLELYGECGIDFTITPHEASISEIAAVAAARYNKDTKPVCFMHGYNILETDLWDITDIDHHDVYYVPDHEFYDYFTKRQQLYNGQKTKIFEGFGIYEYQKCIQIKDRRNKARINNKDVGKKQTVVYSPTFFSGGYRRIDSPSYSDTWYYTFQKELLKYFSTQSDINFIWKGLPQIEPIYNPIPKYINDMKFKNIRVATDPFINHLFTADKVILDYPSTGLYESAIAGVPVMSLYHKGHRVRKDAVDFFGEMVQPFSTIQEALDKVDEFLKNDPKRYCTEIPLSENDIVGILEAII